MMRDTSTHNGELSEQQLAFVRHYTACLSAPHAARQAGYSKSYARKSSKLLKHPGIKAAIEDSQAALRESEGYGQAQAAAELDYRIRRADEDNAHTAIATMMGWKLKLYGLAADRVEVIPLDIKNAIEEARHRVLSVISPQHEQGEDGPALTGGARWTMPTIPGTPKQTPV